MRRSLDYLELVFLFLLAAGIVYLTSQLLELRRTLTNEVTRFDRELAAINRRDSRATNLHLVDLQILDIETGISVPGTRITIEQYALDLRTNAGGFVRLALSGTSGEFFAAQASKDGYEAATFEVELGADQIQRVALHRDDDRDPIRDFARRSFSRNGGASSPVNRRQDRKTASKGL